MCRPREVRLQCGHLFACLECLQRGLERCVICREQISGGYRVKEDSSEEGSSATYGSMEVRACDSCGGAPHFRFRCRACTPDGARPDGFESPPATRSRCMICARCARRQVCPHCRGLIRGADLFELSGGEPSAGDSRSQSAKRSEVSSRTTSGDSEGYEVCFGTACGQRGACYFECSQCPGSGRYILCKYCVHSWKCPWCLFHARLHDFRPLTPRVDGFMSQLEGTPAEGKQCRDRPRPAQAYTGQNAQAMEVTPAVSSRARSKHRRDVGVPRASTSAASTSCERVWLASRANSSLELEPYGQQPQDRHLVMALVPWGDRPRHPFAKGRGKGIGNAERALATSGQLASRPTIENGYALEVEVMPVRGYVQNPEPRLSQMVSATLAPTHSATVISESLVESKGFGAAARCESHKHTGKIAASDCEAICLGDSGGTARPVGSGHEAHIDHCVRANTIIELPDGVAHGDLSASRLALAVISCLVTSLRLRKRLAVILAPTVPIVRQVDESANLFPDMRACTVIGNSEVDHWDKMRWNECVEDKDILITTPQLFLDTLDSGFLHLSNFGALVVLECQHCRGRHPFAMLFSKHYARSLELRVLGLSKNLSKRKDTGPSERQHAIKKLEKIMDSSVYSILAEGAKA